jgi:hypothetical protein
MPKQSYFEGWGFSDRIPVTISATPRKIEILKLELAKSFPDNQVDELDSRNIRFYAREEQLKKLKKFVSIFNGKVYYENGGKLDSKKLVYVLYEPTPRAIKILNENGRTYLNWWQSDLNRGESERLLEKLQMQKLILGGLRYTGDTSDLKFEQGGNIGEALASSNPYIGGAKVIQGIAPESVSALDKKIARKINPDPNRPIFFNNGGGVDIIAPFGTLVSKNKQQKLEYKKVGSNFEFMIYEGLMNHVSNYSRTSFKKTKNGSISMNYDEFLKFIYSNGFVDDQKYALGGGIPRKMELYDAVLYGGKQYDISIKNGVVGLKNLSQGAWGSDYPFIPLSKVDINDVTDMYGNKVEIADKFDNGSSVGQNDYSVARIILQQLGGQGKLVVMTGANNFIAFSNGVSFKLKSKKANYVKITLNGKDLYDVQFQKLFGMKSKVVAEYNDLYFDQLIPIVEKETGMYLKMFKKGGMVSTQNRDMVISQLKAIHHHQKEMLDTLKNSGEVEAWVLAKVSNASNDLSNVAHYLEFKE